MAEGLGKKLEAVLKKLEKLDTIESRLNQTHTTLASIEKNVSRLDSEVEDLKKTKQFGSTVNELKESIQFTDEDMSDLKFANKKLQRDVCELQKQLLYMETYLRRENVKFVGLLEEQVDEDHNGERAKLEDTRGIIFHGLRLKYMRQQMVGNSQNHFLTPTEGRTLLEKVRTKGLGIRARSWCLDHVDP